MDLIEDYQLVFVVGEVELRLGKACPVGLGLEVEIDGLAALSEVSGQSRLAHLPRADKYNGRHLVQ
jgi:hypothetical protein